MEANELLTKSESHEDTKNSFVFNGLTLEFDADRLKYDQIEIKALADPKLNLYGYMKQDRGANFGSRARIVIDSVLNRYGKNILDGRTNKKHLQGMGFSQKDGEYIAYRKVFLAKESDHAESVEVKGRVSFSLPVDWNVYPVASIRELKNASVDPKIKEVDTSFQNSIVFKKTEKTGKIQIVLMSFDENGNRIRAAAMSTSSSGVSYTWKKGSPDFESGFVCIAQNIIELEKPFVIQISTLAN